MDKSTKSFLLLLSLLTVAASIYLYRPYGLYFIADDFIHIPESITNLFEQRNSLRPMGNISLHVDHLFSEQSAKGYHVTNLLLHALNSILLFALAKVLLKKYDNDKDSWWPTIVALIFFIYPFHSETVFWILGRSASLGSLFFIPALICFLLRNNSLFYFISSLLLFELALLSYESSWVFPLLVLAIGFIGNKVNKSQFKVLSLQVTLVWFVFVMHLLLRWKLTGQLFSSYDTASLMHVDVQVIGLNACRLLARTILPPFEHVQWLLVCFFTAIMFLIAVVVKFYRHRLNRTLFLVLGSCWLLSYLPYLSLGIDTHGVEGERYLYLPSMLFCLWLLYVLYKIVNKHWQLGFVMAIIAISVYYLQQSRTYYEKAGAITQNTLNEIGKLPSTKDTIFFQQLPQYHHGAVVFRLGLEDAVQWLHPTFANKCVVVSIDSSDYQRFMSKYSNFGVAYSNEAMSFPLKEVMVKDKTFKTNYLRQPLATPIHINPQKHALFVYQDTTLTVVK
jgi:hypothetical protein